MNSILLNNSYNRKIKRQNFCAIGLMFITLFCSIFITSNFYTSYIQLNEENIMSETKIKSMNSELNSLNEKKLKLENDKETQNTIKQFAWEYREDIILNQLYKPFAGATVDNVTMNKWTTLPIGLNMANIWVTITTKDTVTLKNFLDYLTWEKSEIRFVIKNISFPLDTNDLNSTIKTDISLWMYYYSTK